MSEQTTPESAGTGPDAGAGPDQGAARILYCNCTYAKVVPPEVKNEVLRRLTESGAAFDAVPDLCDMSARKDPALKRLAGTDEHVKIAACYPRAVKWLFHAADTPLPEEGVDVLNMREETAADIVEQLLGSGRNRGEAPGGAVREDEQE